jgi:hypothetical protein
MRFTVKSQEECEAECASIAFCTAYNTGEFNELGTWYYDPVPITVDFDIKERVETLVNTTIEQFDMIKYRYDPNATGALENLGIIIYQTEFGTL